MKTSIEEEMKNDGPLFKNLQADDPEPEATEIESLCVECEETVWAIICIINLLQELTIILIM